MILSCQNIYKSFNENPLLHGVSFHLEAHDKAALIGINGAGKSTLLKIITGEMPPDSGEVTVSRDTSIGYLAQYQESEGDETIYNEVRKAKLPVLEMETRLREMETEMKQASGEQSRQLMEAYTALMHEFEARGGYSCESEITGVLRGLGFEEKDFGRRLSSLSGGQKTRIVLGKLLLVQPDILLLDEPTNHLDMDSVIWLENYLSNYRGTVLIVSHDRFFLDRIVNRVIEIENGTAQTYAGNYTAFSEKKAIQRNAQIQAWTKQQAEIRHQEAVITKLRQFNREKSIRRAESREKKLDRMDRLEKPVSLQTDMRISLKPRTESGNDVLTVEGLAKAWPALTLFEDLSFQIRKGERVAIIGSNGTGKTTILKMINQVLPPDAGRITLGAKVHIGYYDQEQQLLHDEKTVFEELADTYPTLTNTEIRNVLASFLFTGDDVFKQISALSGGERGRVSLARLMLSESNFLILDEPTNHLDIQSREILEDALRSYTGTVLYVSHDRYFINRTATRILELHNRKLTNYLGNYDYYLEKRDTLRPAAQADPRVPEKEIPQTTGKADWKEQKEEQAKRRKKQNELKRTEEKIAALEARRDEIDAEFSDPATGTDLARCQKLSAEREGVCAELDELYERWEELAEEE